MEKRSNDIDNEQRDNVSGDGPAEQDITLTPGQELKTEPQEEPASVIEKLQAQIADKDKEIAELKDRLLRSLAENENARKRMRQQSDETVRLQRENFLRELLPVVDNLE